MDYQTRLISTLFENKKPHSKGLFIYQNNYIETGIRALSINYPTLLQLMGVANFRAFAKAYLHYHPKKCFDWAEYGEQVAAFLCRSAEIQNTPYLPEIARLDWLILQVERSTDIEFDAASFALLQQHEAEHLCFKTAPGLQLIEAVFPLVELYAFAHSKQLLSQEKLRNAHLSEIKQQVDIAIKNQQSRSIVIWREEYKASFAYLPPKPYEAVKRLLKASPVSHVLAAFENDESAISEWLKNGIETKLICAVIEQK